MERFRVVLYPYNAQNVTHWLTKTKLIVFVKLMIKWPFLARLIIKQSKILVLLSYPICICPFARTAFYNYAHALIICTRHALFQKFRQDDVQYSANV
jgi:hypothetical protein